MFIESLVKKTGTDKVEGDWFEEWWNKDLSANTVPVNSRTKKATNLITKNALGDQNSINDLVFQALGSMDNRPDFVLCRSDINTAKMRTWMKHNYMDLGKFNQLLKDFERGAALSTEVLSVFRTVGQLHASNCLRKHADICAIKIFGVFSYMNLEEVKERLVHISKNVQDELSNIPQLTQENKGLDTKWEAFIQAHLKDISKHARDWLTARYPATKAAYKAAIEDLKKQETALKADKGKVLMSDLKQHKADIQRLEQEAIQLKKDKTDIQEARQPLQTALYKAIKTKNQAAIDKADSELQENAEKLDSIKSDITENKRGTYRAKYILQTQLLSEVQKLIAELEDHQESLLAFEKKTPSLKMPTV